MKVSVVIPVLNYEKKLEDTIKKIKNEVIDVEIIVVCDITKLNLVEKARKLSKKLNKSYGVRTIFRINKKGFGSALRYGFIKASGKVVVVMMGDLCDDPKTIPKMLKKIEEGYDVVVGCRYCKEGKIIGNTIKQRVSNFVSVLVSIFSKIRCKDVNNAFKMYRKEVLENIRTKSESFDMSIELLVKSAISGYKIAEVPTVWRNRDTGKSKFNFFREAKNYFKWFLYAAIKFPSFITKLIFISLTILIIILIFTV